MSEKTPTGKTPIEVFCRAAELGLKLGVRPGNKLTVQPIEACPKDFLETLRAHKWYLLCILSWPFCMVYSEVLQETIFFVEDEDTKASLVEAGADPFSIYTRQELHVLIEHNRAKPFIPSELLCLHKARRMFESPSIAASI
jgi:hypothetical protein